MQFLQIYFRSTSKINLLLLHAAVYICSLTPMCIICPDHVTGNLHDFCPFMDNVQEMGTKRGGGANGHFTSVFEIKTTEKISIFAIVPFCALHKQETC